MSNRREYFTIIYNKEPPENSDFIYKTIHLCLSNGREVELLSLGGSLSKPIKDHIKIDKLIGKTVKEIIMELYKDIDENDYNYFYHLYKIGILDDLFTNDDLKTGNINDENKLFQDFQTTISNKISKLIYEETKKLQFGEKYYYLEKLGVRNNLSKQDNINSIESTFNSLFAKDDTVICYKLFRIIRVYHIIKNDYPFYLYQSKYGDKRKSRFNK